MAGNSEYKKWHKPSNNAKTHQGYYKVANPAKYVGDPELCIYRSGWEMSFCKWCDVSPSVIRWSSEPVKIPYYDRVANLEMCKQHGLNPNLPANWKIRNYNVDFWVEVLKNDQTIERWLVEVKPGNKLTKPEPPEGKSTLKADRNYVYRAKEYLINEAKFAACDAYAKKNNCKYYVFTEHTLKSLLGNLW